MHARQIRRFLYSRQLCKHFAPPLVDIDIFSDATAQKWTTCAGAGNDYQTIRFKLLHVDSASCFKERNA